MDKGQANRLAFELGKTILDQAQDFETDVAGKPVTVTVQRTGAKRPTQPLPGLGESEYQQWPEKIHAHCEWSEGSVTLGMRLTYWSTGDQRHGGELVTDIEIVDSDISLLWVTLADPFIKEKFLDGQAQLPARVGLMRRKDSESAETGAGYNQALQALIPESEYPHIDKRTVSFGTASAATGTPLPNGQTIFEHAIFLALLKAPFLLRANRTGREVETLIDIEGLSSATINHSAPTAKNADKLTQWERAYWILFDANEPLSTQQILDEIKNRGWPKVGGKPNNTIWTRLYEHSENNSKSQSSHFENLGKNHWVLTKWGRANSPCPRPATAPQSTDYALRQALGLDRLRGLWPLPGGTSQYKKSLDVILTTLGHETMSEANLIQYLTEEFEAEGGPATKRYIGTIKQLGLIENVSGVMQLTEEGIRYVENSTATEFFRLLDNTYSGIFATLVLAEVDGLLTTKGLLKSLNQLLQMKWATVAQANRRRRYLHSAGLLQKASNGFALSGTGRSILNNRREDADLITALYRRLGGTTGSPEETATAERAPWPQSLLDQCKSWGLPHVTNLVLEGVPGTGKTYAIKQITKADTTGVLQGRGEGRHAITLHPATSYEDFVEGLRPGAQPPIESTAWWHDELQTEWIDKAEYEGIEWFFENPSENDGDAQASNFTIHDGFFLRVCREAIHFPHKDFLVLLDEINRCNVPKVLGDLLTTLERAKRATWDSTNQHWDLSKAQVVTLPYSKRAFFVPDNVFVVATMNTTDRSVAPLDAALRRRFGFYRVWPMGFQEPTMDLRENKPKERHKSVRTPTELLNSGSTKGEGRGSVAAVDLLLSKLGEGKKKDAKEWLRRSVVTWVSLNAALLVDLGPDAMLGHSYLFDMADDLNAEDSDPRWRGDAEKSHAIISRHWSRYMLPQLADILVSNNRIDLADRSNIQKESSLWKVLKDLRSGWLWGDGFRSTIEGTGLNRMPVFQLDVPSTIPEIKKDNPSVADEDIQNEGTPLEGIEE